MNLCVLRSSVIAVLLSLGANALALEIRGAAVIPHAPVREMQFRRPIDFRAGARIQLFVINETAEPVRVDELEIDGLAPAGHMKSGDWSWHDTPAIWAEGTRPIPPGALSCWTYNQVEGFDDGKRRVTVAGETLEVELRRPRVWLEAVTFLGTGDALYPNRIVVHVRNTSTGPISMRSLRLWLPKSNATFRHLYPTAPVKDAQLFPASGVIDSGDTGCLVARVKDLPLTYAAVELLAENASKKPLTLWSHLRIKKEVFDIGGGWVSSNRVPGGSLRAEPYLKTLRALHISSGMHDSVPGYTDQTGPDSLYARYPIKMMNRLQPVERFDRDDVLPRIHAVEFLGEPQYRARTKGKMPPAVLEAFRPYAPTRLATSVTLSDASTWHLWAGLSDYPHYDAYRVTAPMADSWRSYDRWGGVRIGWGAPLETIGDMTRSLRENSRPASIAYWSQGPHEGWRGYDGRQRSSPTVEELRAQAYHGLSSRITSLYWFNLSLRSLLKFRDTLPELQRIGREIRLLDDYYLEGCAHSYRRVLSDSTPSADLAVIAAPRGALLFFLDLEYEPDPEEKVFRFPEHRKLTLEFRLPSYLRDPKDVFRVDAEGTHDVEHEVSGSQVRVTDRVSNVGIWVAAPNRGERERLKRRLGQLLEYERSFDFDPGRIDGDFEKLRGLLGD